MSNARKHAKYSASKAHRWMNCHGSVRACEHLPDDSGDSAMDGNESHDFIEFSLRGGHRDAAIAIYEYGFGKWTHRRDTFEERIEAVQVCLDHVYGLLDFYPDALLSLERRFDFPTRFLPEEAYGYADIVIYVPSLKLLFIVDYKHGMKPVMAQGNSQLMFYGVGAMHMIPENVTNITMTIVQPRAFYSPRIRHMHATAEQALAFIPLVEEAITICEQPDAAFNPGDWCEYCPFSSQCKAREDEALSLLPQQFGSVEVIPPEWEPPPANTIGIDRIARILDLKPRFDQWFKSVEDHARKTALDGGNVPGYKLVEAQAKRRYDGDEHEIVEALGYATFGSTWEDWGEGGPYNDMRPRSILGITEMEAYLKRAFKAKAEKDRGSQNKAAEAASNLLAKHTVKASSGNVVLVSVADSRPEIDRVKQHFAAVQVEQG